MPPRSVLAPDRRRPGDQSAGHGDWGVREMSGFGWRPRAVVACLLGGAALSGGLSTSAAGAKPVKPPVYSLANVGGYGGEPSIWANGKGELYDTTPSGGTVLYKSTDRGVSWTQATTADTASGDDCVFTDQSDALYLCNLAGSQSTGPLQADVWKSVDDGQSGMYGNNNVNQLGGQNVCRSSCNPFGVDRPWADAYIPAGGTTGSARVVLMYHDFFGPSPVWGNVSTDGRQTFGPPSDILTHLTGPGANQGVVAQADSACNTVPAGLRIEKTGPHPGRIYAAWIASDPESAGTGCHAPVAAP